jgi:hypothetical protein
MRLTMTPTTVAVSAVAGILMLLIQHAVAQTSPQEGYVPSPEHRMCVGTDLMGETYKMLVLREAPAKSEAAWVNQAPYHYLVFYTATAYSFIASDREITTPDEARKAMTWPQKSNHVLNYTLDDQGVLDLYLDGELKYHYHCLTTDISTPGSYQKGDLILTATTKADTSLYKWYRRWD